MNQNFYVNSLKSKLRFIRNFQNIDALICLMSTIFSCMVHFILTIVYFEHNLMILCYYNMVSSIFFLLLTVIIKRKMFHVFYVLSYTEIVLHAIISTFLLGWSFNFILYVACVIPLSFYYLPTVSNIKRKILAPFIFAFAGNLLLVLSVILSNRFGTYYQSDDYPRSLYIFLNAYNYVVCFIVLVNFSGLFIYKILVNNQELEKQNKKLELLANYDQLTGLISRQHMSSIYEKYIDSYHKENRPFSIIVGDIDNFKRVNDLYGHDCGDFVLKEMSKTILNCTKEDGHVSRWGGEEILIILNGPLEVATKKAEKIRSAIEDLTLHYNYVTIKNTMTFGVSEYNSSSSIGSIIIDADNKMYQGKTSTKNCVIS